MEEASNERQEEPVAVWCHSCNRQTEARMNKSLGEFECQSCQGTFVEELNQGVEGFLEQSNRSRENQNPQANSTDRTENNSNEGANRTAARDDDSPVDHNQIIQHILSRVLGITAQLPTQGGDDTGITVINQVSDGSGGRRPVGFIVRHAPITLSDETEAEGGAGFPRGLFGLLNSLSAIRSGSHQGDALSNTQFEDFLHHILMNESSHAGAPPASESVIANLKKIAVAADTNLSGLGECCISQEPFETGDTVVCLPCGHNYKEEPIVHWLKMHNTCPVCRIEINQSNSG